MSDMNYVSSTPPNGQFRLGAQPKLTFEQRVIMAAENKVGLSPADRAECIKQFPQQNWGFIKEYSDQRLAAVVLRKWSAEFTVKAMKKPVTPVKVPWFTRLYRSVGGRFKFCVLSGVAAALAVCLLAVLVTSLKWFLSL